MTESLFDFLLHTIASHEPSAMWRLRKRIADDYNKEEIPASMDMLHHFSGFCDRLCALQAPPHQSFIMSSLYVAFMARKAASRIAATQAPFQEALSLAIRCHHMLSVTDTRNTSIIETRRIRAFDKWKAARFLWSAFHQLLNIPYNASCFSSYEVSDLTDGILSVTDTLRKTLIDSAGILLDSFKGVSATDIMRLTEGALDPDRVNACAHGHIVDLHELVCVRSGNLSDLAVVWSKKECHPAYRVAWQQRMELLDRMISSDVGVHVLDELIVVVIRGSADITAEIIAAHQKCPKQIAIYCNENLDACIASVQLAERLHKETLTLRAPIVVTAGPEPFVVKSDHVRHIDLTAMHLDPSVFVGISGLGVDFESQLRVVGVID